MFSLPKVAAGTKRRSQVTGHRSQVTGHRKCNKKVRHCFIDHASRCYKSKRTKYQKLHIVLELEEFFLSFGFLETSKRCFNLRSTRRNLD